MGGPGGQGCQLTLIFEDAAPWGQPPGGPFAFWTEYTVGEKWNKPKNLTTKHAKNAENFFAVKYLGWTEERSS